MAVLKLNEILAANTGEDRDQFELFAREFLTMKGFLILTGPDRGPDAGRDLIVEETRIGVAGVSKIRWLVSCKHKAHSGSSVSPTDEPDLHDRIKTHNCAGFIGFYSTIPSSGLATKFAALKQTCEVLIFDQENIERELLSSKDGLTLARRFLPLSLAGWEKENPKAARIFAEAPSLQCAACQKELLGDAPSGILVFWKTYSSTDAKFKRKTEHLYCCCKGKCDDVLRRKYGTPGLIDSWEDLPDLIIPIAYLRMAVALLNELESGETYSPAAFDKVKDVVLNLFPMISREPSQRDDERIRSLSAIPVFLGGWGYPSE